MLVKAKIYEYIKYSTIFKFYATLFKPGVKHSFEREVRFYSSFLFKCHLIFDIGANDGHKTEAFLKIAEKVVSCEPDLKNFNTLCIRFRKRRKRVRLENKAIAAAPGTHIMYLHHPGSAFNTLNVKFKEITEADNLQKWNEKINYENRILVETTTLDDLIKTYGKPEFIKIDVEGYELEVIKGLSVLIKYISIECLFPDFEAEFYEIVARLKKISSKLRFNIAMNEQLLFDEFLPEGQLNNYLITFNHNHFELIINMQEE